MHFKLTFLLLMATGISAALLTGCNGKSSDQNKKNNSQSAVSVNATIIAPGLLEDRIYSTGTLLSNEEVEIRSEVSGRIVQINFPEGGNVKKGDLLVKINDDELQAQLKKLQLDEKLAKDDVYRKSKLLEMKAVSQEEYDKSYNQLQIIEAQIDLVKAQVDKTGIYAPFSGQIGLRYISPGGYISPNTLIARLQEVNPVKVEFSVPERYMGKVATGTKIHFTVEGNDSSYAGTVFAVEKKIEIASRSLTVRAQCPNPGNVLVPGSFARVEIILQRIPEALVVPAEAIIPDIRGEKVFKYVNGKVVAAYVKTGVRTDVAVQIVNGLAPGDTVVTTGLLQLKDGMNAKVDHIVSGSSH